MIYTSSILQDAYDNGFKDGSKDHRDHLAGLAMEAIISLWGEHAIENPDEVAVESHKIADAMMEAKK